MRCEQVRQLCLAMQNTKEPYLYKLKVLFAKYAFQYFVQPVLRAIVNGNDLCQHLFRVERRCNVMSRGGKAYAGRC